MKSVSLNAFPRTLARRGGSKKLRASGRVPAVIYGRKTQPQNLEVDLKEIQNIIHHSVTENVLVDLALQGAAQRLALIQDVQHHPLSGHVLHLDLHEVAENETVTIMVPVETTGEAVGVKTGGGVLEHVLFKVKVQALPRDLPEVITVDITNLQVGQSIHIGDLQPPAGVTILGDKKVTVVTVAAPLTEAQEAAAAAASGAPGEVEAIKEKKDETAAAPAAKGGDKKAAAGGEKKPADKKK